MDSAPLEKAAVLDHTALPQLKTCTTLAASPRYTLVVLYGTLICLWYPYVLAHAQPPACFQPSQQEAA